MRKRVLVAMNASYNLYQKIDSYRKKFKEVNGIDITLIQAGELFAKHTRSPRIPNLLKNGNKKYKKSRPY